jgi:hypothetical protein
VQPWCCGCCQHGAPTMCKVGTWAARAPQTSPGVHAATGHWLSSRAFVDADAFQRATASSTSCSAFSRLLLSQRPSRPSSGPGCTTSMTCCIDRPTALRGDHTPKMYGDGHHDGAGRMAGLRPQPAVNGSPDATCHLAVRAGSRFAAERAPAATPAPHIRIHSARVCHRQNNTASCQHPMTYLPT